MYIISPRIYSFALFTSNPKLHVTQRLPVGNAEVLLNRCHAGHVDPWLPSNYEQTCSVNEANQQIQNWETSSLNSLLYSFNIGSTSWIWPRVKPTTSIRRSDLAVNWLKSWHVGDGPRYVFFSMGRVRSAAFAIKHVTHFRISQNTAVEQNSTVLTINF